MPTTNLYIQAADSFFLFLFNAYKIFYKINAGAGLGLATPLTTAVSVIFSLDNECIYSVAEHLSDHIKPEMYQTRAPLHISARRESNERGNDTAFTARVAPVHAVSCILSYQSVK